MNYEGVIIGLAAFVIIGVFHPVVIKGEYYFGARIWPIFLVVGLASVIASLFIERTFVAALLGVFGFTCLWTIKELYEQEERVKKGWFPANPNRKTE
ncbi:MAG: DUF4491 family protein [bacterium]|nr:DUF4491 family protein [bacterium]